VTEISGGPGATIDHYKLLRDGAAAFHIGSMHVGLDRSASFVSHAITLGGAIARSDVDATLAGEGAECTLNGLYLANGTQLVDTHTTIRHAQPHCSSHELYKGILDDHARAVFNGKIVVSIDAQKTDAKQTNKALLLSEDAQINTKPELEIFADDVRCTHGATVGQLDADALFYLRARGLALDQARNVLIHAFASDLLNRIAIAPIRARLDSLLLQQLPGLGGGAFYERPA
jgi:Fe-S cluster assembly protein SufD